MRPDVLYIRVLLCSLNVHTERSISGVPSKANGEKAIEPWAQVQKFRGNVWAEMQSDSGDVCLSPRTCFTEALLFRDQKINANSFWTMFFANP